MPGYFVVRPIEANLTHDTELVGKMSPYCTFQIGRQKMRSQVCNKGGKHPHWNDAITLPATQPKVTVEVMDKDIVTHDDQIGSFTLDLQEIQAAGQLSKWYPLSYKDRSAGEILLETVYQPGTSIRQGSYNNNSSFLSGQNQSYYQGQQYANTSMAGGMVGTNVLGNLDQSSYHGQQQYASNAGMIGGQSQYYAQGQQYASKGQYYNQQGSQYYKQQAQVQTQVQTSDTAQHNVWTEQVQVVTPHVFTKEIDVVETRPVLKEVEIMEPRKVLKEVQYTQAVPVKKQIEVTKPEVVVKEIEVMEPRVVTKTIQVVENVTVSRPVQVIEMKNSVQEVETLEPQTFHKPIEVTEYMPVKKQIEVTQPVTLKKAVEFIEPVITTQTITKEEFEPVIINEQVTTSVGPASVVAMSTEYGYIKQFSDLSLTETKHLGGLKRWIGYETIFCGLTDEERIWEQQRLSRLSEQDWIRERERLMKLNEQERLLQQRSFFQKLRDKFSRKPTATTFQYSNRWQGLDNWFTGLNEKERFFAQDRINRLSEPEWIAEKERLMKLNDQDRILEQRCLYMKAINDGYEFGPTITQSVGPNIQISQPL